MENFVNRDAEIKLIEDQFNVLLQKNPLMRTQIIEFYGVGGIGKTTILQKIRHTCSTRQLASLWADASQTIPAFSRELIKQVRQYNVQFIPQGSDFFDQSVTATRALLSKGPVVFLIDSLDAADEERLIWIEKMLEDLTVDDRLFAVLASKRVVSFQRIMSVARRLFPQQLQPFNQESYTKFLDNLEQKITIEEIRDIIFEWTDGYPLAVNVMVQAIQKNNLDPRLEQDQKRLLAMITEQVIQRGVLANVPQTPRDLEWYQTILSLFSVPRRCNLNIMQRIVERFAPDYKLGSSLAYISLPKRINQTTDVLNWNTSKAGFSVEGPIRHIFLTKLKLEEHDKYVAVHRFLAITNRRLADEVIGTDRARYLQEYLYHSANCETGITLQQILERTMQQIIAEPPEYFLQFHEDFLRDQELKTALGIYSNTVISIIYRRRTEINRQIALETSRPEYFFDLRQYFYHLILDPVPADVIMMLRYNVQQILEVEPIDICNRLYKELSQDVKIKERLGEDISILSALLRS